MLATAATTPPEQIAANREWRAGVLGSVNFLAVMLSVRLLALVGIIGAGLLSWLIAASPGDLYRIVTLAIYCAGTALVVWLASRK